jgi:heptosyltransferase-2
MLEAVGIEGELRPPRLRPDAGARAEADTLMENAGIDRAARPMMFYIGGRPSRRWPAERFGLLGRGLLGERGGALVAVSGREDAERAREIARAVGAGASAVVDQSLAGLVAMLARAAFVVSHDSAAAHIAAAVGAPTVVIGGATDPDIWGPYGERARMVYDPTLECLGCKSAECVADRHLCMEAVTPEMVVEAIGEITGGP